MRFALLSPGPRRGKAEAPLRVHRACAPLHVALDNFCEDEHTPWVHSFLGWKESQLPQLEFESSNFDDRTEVYYHAPQHPSIFTPALLIEKGDVFHNQWVTRFDPVRTVYTLHWRDPKTDAMRPVMSRFAIYFVYRVGQDHMAARLRLREGDRSPLPGAPAGRAAAGALHRVERSERRRALHPQCRGDAARDEGDASRQVRQAADPQPQAPREPLLVSLRRHSAAFC